LRLNSEAAQSQPTDGTNSKLEKNKDFHDDNSLKSIGPRLLFEFSVWDLQHD